MLTNLTYLIAGTIALMVVATHAPTRAVIPAAIALAIVLATVATLSQGPDALIRVIDALTRLLPGSPSG